MGMHHPPKPLVFISYSHEDEQWIQEFLRHLKPLKDRDFLDCWNDKEIDPGQEWQKEIERALIAAKIAVLLVSPHFLASDYISKEELPRILAKTGHHPKRIFWIPISDSNYKYTEIVNYQAVHDPAEPLDAMPESRRNTVFRQISEQIMEAIRPHSGL